MGNWHVKWSKGVGWSDSVRSSSATGRRHHSRKGSHMSDYGSTPPPPPPPPPSSPYGGQGAAGTPPPNYLVWAILSTVLCCLPLGVASIVFSTQVNSKWALGDVAGAQDSSAKAKKFAIWSAIAWAIVAALYLIFFVVLAGMSSNS